MREKYKKYIEPPRLISIDSSLTKPVSSDQGNAVGGLVCLSSLRVQSAQPKQNQSGL